MTRSIPEKTFEHWLSMYVAHRFPTGGLWWPARDEDITVEDLGTVPGKACLLEAKVSEQKPASHQVTIDLPQLQKYVASAAPVYYAIPEPPWIGNLVGSVWIGPERRADLAYRRSQQRWFGNWTYVCTASDLLAHIAPAKGQKRAVLATPPPQRWSWPTFWRLFAECGSQAMPALFLVPDDLGPQTRRGDLRESLSVLTSDFRSAGAAGRESLRRELQTSTNRFHYVPTADSDTYRRIDINELREDTALRRPPADLGGPGVSPLGDNREDGVPADDEVTADEVSVAALPFDSLTV